MKYVALMVIVVLAGCAGATPWNPQNNAGLTRASFSYDKDKALHGEIVSGREHEKTSLRIKSPDGLEVEYSADGTKAFEGQENRSKVEKKVSGDTQKALDMDILK